MNAHEKHQQRVRDLLGGQDAPLIDGQRHILGHCPHCDRIWLQRGGANALHLTPEDIRTWAQHLHADPDHLPHRVCRACQLRLVGGEFAIDEYVDPMRGDIGGYGVSWECATPPQHCIVTATKVAWLDRRPFVPEPSIVTNATLCEAVLRSLAHLPPHARTPLAPRAGPGPGKSGPPHRGSLLARCSSPLPRLSRQQSTSCFLTRSFSGGRSRCTPSNSGLRASSNTEDFL